MMQDIVQVDAFTSEPFKGNPAAVCIMAGPADEEWMQNVAKEMNLAETAFVYPIDDGFSLRWFTPGAEVQLCGHATLASAHVLFADKHVSAGSEIKFHTKYSGILTVKQDNGRLQMNFPVLPVKEADAPTGLSNALGVPIVATYAAQSDGKLIVETNSTQALRNCIPDMTFLKTLDYISVCVTTEGDEGYDFISRFFAPRLKIDEDPATGSVQCALVDLWSKKLNKQKFHAYQASERGGEFNLEIKGDRCLIGGEAIITMRGKLEV